MTVTAVRPRVDEYQFRFFDRPLHPELFETVSSREVTKGACTIRLRVIPHGHVIEWSAAGVTAAELIARPDQPLPTRGQRLAHRFDGGHAGTCRLGAVKYRVQLQVERFDARLFRRVHEDLIVDGVKRGLLVRHDPWQRTGLSPLSWLDVTPVVGGLAVFAIHTFPGDLAIAKSQSLIEPVVS
jgi:hypothetical protein